MAKRTFPVMPENPTVERLLTAIRPKPSTHFYKKMEQTEWLSDQGSQKNMRNTSNLRLALTVVILFLLGAILLITPQGRAFAQGLLRFFNRANSDSIPVPTQVLNWINLTPSPDNLTSTPQATSTPLAAFATDCGDFPLMLCSVEQIRSKVNFTVKEPAHIPAGLYFTGATGGPESIYLRYEYENNMGSLFVTEQRWTSPFAISWPEIGANATVEEVQIGNLIGEYFMGSFVQNASAGEKVATWDPNFQQETLRWVEEGIAYTLRYSYTTQVPLGKDGLTNIAKAMTTQPVAKLPMPATVTPAPALVQPTLSLAFPERMGLEIELVERQAGFKLKLPSRLPQNLAPFGGAVYDNLTNVARIWFLQDPGNLNGLYLNQQLISNPSDCFLCDVIVGDDNLALLVHGPEIVNPDAQLQTVKVGNGTGKSYIGMRLGDGSWEGYTDILHLRWQVDGRAFELISLSAGLSLEDLIMIAESME